MTAQEKLKCAHIPGVCEVAMGQEFCSEVPQERGKQDVEIACQCDHVACPLTL